jgi:hypothetical protein
VHTIGTQERASADLVHRRHSAQKWYTDTEQHINCQGGVHHGGSPTRLHKHERRLQDDIQPPLTSSKVQVTGASTQSSYRTGHSNKRTGGCRGHRVISCNLFGWYLHQI